MEKVPSFRETLKQLWANTPGVGFAKDKKGKAVPVVKKKEKVVERIEIKAPPKVKVLLPPPRKKPRKAPRKAWVPTRRPGEIYTEEAAAIIGVSSRAFLDVILHNGNIPTYSVTKRKLMREEDVRALWDLLCDAKGVPRGTKLGDLKFLGHLPKKEKVKLCIVHNDYRNNLQI